MTSQTGLLVSVRSVAEAEAALGGGADIIDVKEPHRGALGRADDETIAEIVRFVAGRRPVSAAMGELVGTSTEYSVPSTQYSVLSTRGVCFLKWGLANSGRSDWISALDGVQAVSHLQVVTVAYADWQLAQAPPVDEILEYVLERPNGVLLIDTWCKTGPSLLSWLSEEAIYHICEVCHNGGVRIALAGSLDVSSIETLRDANPDWFAVRSAACDDGRQGQVSARKVRALADVIRLAASRREARAQP